MTDIVTGCGGLCSCEILRIPDNRLTDGGKVVSKRKVTIDSGKSILRTRPNLLQSIGDMSPLIQPLEQVAKQQHEIKTLADNLVKVQPESSDSYRTIIVRHFLSVLKYFSTPLVLDLMLSGPENSPIKANFHFRPTSTYSLNRNEYQESSWRAKRGRCVLIDNLATICMPVV
jgi:hypothetical protein